MGNRVNIDVVVGQRQVMRQLKQQNISKILLACDAEESYKQSIIDSAKAHNVPISIVGTSHDIATTYEIEVKSAVVGVLKSPLSE